MGKWGQPLIKQASGSRRAQSWT